MIEVNGSSARVSVSYSLKVPAAASYSSEDSHVGYSIEFDTAGKDTETIIGELEALQAQLLNTAKLTVFAQLGVEFEASATGILAPVLKDRPEPAKKAAPRPPARAAAPRSGGGGGGYGGGQFAPPKGKGRDLDVVMLGGTAYFDQRVLKEDGTYKPGAADFKSVNKVNGDNLQLWIVSREGHLNDDVVAMLDEAGLEWAA